MRRSALRRPSPTVAALLAITAAALAVRLWDLGWRVAHQDEGRVADWTLHYISSGHWEYRAIIHGPFLPHVNGMLFPAIGASDFTARLVVAVVGGLLPLAAWLFRSRLDRVEVVGLAALLAVNPVMVYYSRFMRNDVLLAAFALFALGFALRAVDTGDARLLHPAALSLGLAFTTKENALLYVMAWAGALALVLDFALLRAATRRRGAGDDPLAGPNAGGLRSTLLDWGGRVRTRAWAWRRHWPLALVEFAVVVLLFYAPLPGLWNAATDPTLLPGVLEEATWGTWQKFTGQWAIPGMRDHAYTEFATFYLSVLEAGGLALISLAVLGALVARYGDDHRPFVAFATYWGLASIAGYPIVMDIQAAWNAAHSLVPLAIPAAVGVGVLGRPLLELAPDDRLDAVLVTGVAAGAYGALRVLRDGGLGAALEGDPTAVVALVTVAAVLALAAAALRDTPVRRPSEAQIVAGIAAAGLVLAAFQAGAVAYETSFERPQDPDNELVQYAQPSGLMQETLREIDAIAAVNDGTDVLFYGTIDYGEGCEFAQPTETWAPPDDPPCGWFSRLPMAWYFTANDVETDSATGEGPVVETEAPVVLALSNEAYGISENTAEDVAPELTDRGYEQRSYQGYLWGRKFVVFVDEDALAATGA